MVTISSYTPTPPPPPPHSSFHSYHSDVTCQGLFRMWIARPQAQHVSCRGRIEPIKEMDWLHQMPLIIRITFFALSHVHLYSYLFILYPLITVHTSLCLSNKKNGINSDKLSLSLTFTWVPRKAPADYRSCCNPSVAKCHMFQVRQLLLVSV